jgi:hypothetical protein
MRTTSHHSPATLSLSVGSMLAESIGQCSPSPTRDSLAGSAVVQAAREGEAAALQVGPAGDQSQLSSEVTYATQHSASRVASHKISLVDHLQRAIRGVSLEVGEPAPGVSVYLSSEV